MAELNFTIEFSKEQREIISNLESALEKYNKLGEHYKVCGQSVDEFEKGIGLCIKTLALNAIIKAND